MNNGEITAAHTLKIFADHTGPRVDPDTSSIYLLTSAYCRQLLNKGLRRAPTVPVLCSHRIHPSSSTAVAYTTNVIPNTIVGGRRMLLTTLLFRIMHLKIFSSFLAEKKKILTIKVFFSYGVLCRNSSF